jgi:predicted double-glycine peptidase
MLLPVQIGRIAYRLIAVLFLLWPFAAAGAEPVRSLLEMRRQGVIVQEWDVSCGAAALATVLTYSFKDPVSEKAVAQAMLRRTDPLRVKVRGGFSLLDMKRFAESRGYSAAGFRSVSIEELLAMHSPIVPIDEYGDPHFVVVRGLREGKVDIADPGFGNRTMSVERFRAAWKDGIAFIVTREKR